MHFSVKTSAFLPVFCACFFFINWNKVKFQGRTWAHFFFFFLTMSIYQCSTADVCLPEKWHSCHRASARSSYQVSTFSLQKAFRKPLSQSADFRSAHSTFCSVRSTYSITEMQHSFQSKLCALGMFKWHLHWLHCHSAAQHFIACIARSSCNLLLVCRELTAS